MQKDAGAYIRVIGQGFGFACQLRGVDDLRLEVIPNMPGPATSLGSIEKDAAGFVLRCEFGVFTGRDVLEVAKEAWIAFAKLKGASRIWVNNYPHHPTELELGM